jgi:hypothetical protein
VACDRIRPAQPTTAKNADQRLANNRINETDDTKILRLNAPLLPVLFKHLKDTLTNEPVRHLLALNDLNSSFQYKLNQTEVDA